ncbi:MAG: RNA-binding protein [Parachlamydiaceae bacterium]|nr:RNA-binding protein [Parachlamydiaceae bacterium]
MKKIFVGNLSWKTTEEMLKKHFEAFGEVVSAKIVIDQMTGKSKGFGFVEMADADSANNAIRELDGKELLDRELRISLAMERKDMNQSGGGRGDRGGDRGEYRERREREPRGNDSYGNRSNYR